MSEKKEKTRKIGAPSSYTPELGLEICRRISEGEFLRGICKSPEMPNRSTITDWILRIPEFAAQYAHARLLQADQLFEECLEIADDGGGDIIIDESGKKRVDHENIHRSRLKVDTRKWLCAKIHHQKYGDKIQQELSSNAESPVVIIHAGQNPYNTTIKN